MILTAHHLRMGCALIAGLSLLLFGNAPGLLLSAGLMGYGAFRLGV